MQQKRGVQLGKAQLVACCELLKTKARRHAEAREGASRDDRGDGVPVPGDAGHVGAVDVAEGRKARRLAHGGRLVVRRAHGKRRLVGARERQEVGLLGPGAEAGLDEARGQALRPLAAERLCGTLEVGPRELVHVADAQRAHDLAGVGQGLPLGADERMHAQGANGVGGERHGGAARERAVCHHDDAVEVALVHLVARGEGGGVPQDARAVVEGRVNRICERPLREDVDVADEEVVREAMGHGGKLAPGRHHEAAAHEDLVLPAADGVGGHDPGVGVSGVLHEAAVRDRRRHASSLVVGAEAVEGDETDDVCLHVARSEGVEVVIGEGQADVDVVDVEHGRRG